MDVLMKILYLAVEILLEFLIVMVVYELVSYFQSKKNFSIKKTFNESWLICFVIALVVVMMNHII